MTPSKKLRSIADSTGLDGIADAIREIANAIEHNNAPAVPLGYINAGHLHEMQSGRLPYAYLYAAPGVGVEIPVYTSNAPAVPQGAIVGYRVSHPTEPDLGTWLVEEAPTDPTDLLVEPLVLAATPAPAPAQERCHLCDCTGDIHDATGEWRGECPYCKPAQVARLDWAVRTLRGIADQGRAKLGDNYPTIVQVIDTIKTEMRCAAPAQEVGLTNRQFDLICQAIDKADTVTMDGDYMLDSDDCIRVVRVMQVLFDIAALRAKGAV